MFELNTLLFFNQPYNEFSAVIVAAVLIDFVFGEPPNALHPVVWIGKLIAFLKKLAPKSNKKIYGVCLGLTTMTSAGIGALLILYVTNMDFVPSVVRVLIQAFFLKSTFAIRSMVTPADSIYKEMKKSQDREKIKFELRTYVSRDTKDLTDEQISSAVVESISENYVDSILSPIFYYIIFGPLGLAAAYCFKAISTLDSMIGYKDEENSEIGWFSAKTDDILNWVPARISPFFLALGALFSNFLPISKERKQFSPKECLIRAQEEHGVSLSPNSGWSMAAASGALQVRLEKKEEYVIGKKYRKTNITDIKRMSVLLVVSSTLTIAVFLLIVRAIVQIQRYNI